MRAATLHGAGDVRVETVPDPRIIEPGDAIVRVELTCICGSDLWYYRGTQPSQPGQRTGHEFVGVVVEVGAEVRTLRPGDRVIAPFVASDGTCDYCEEGLTTSCRNIAIWGLTPGCDGGQGEAVRVPHADGTLVTVPAGTDDAMLPALLSLSDVMGTGYHAAKAARVRPGSTVAVVGDGAVGLCAVLAARRMGAERIIALSSHFDRSTVARRFGATDIVTERGAEAVERVMELTGGRGAGAVLECVGSEQSWETSVGIARDGATIGWVGFPHTRGPELNALLFRNVAIAGGLAPVRAYLPKLLAEVLDGHLDPAPVFDDVVSLADIADGYKAMDTRSALKVLVRP